MKPQAFFPVPFFVLSSGRQRVNTLGQPPTKGDKKGDKCPLLYCILQSRQVCGSCYICCFFSPKVSYSPGWTQACYVTENNLKLLFFLDQLWLCWDAVATISNFIWCWRWVQVFKHSQSYEATSPTLEWSSIWFLGRSPKGNETQLPTEGGLYWFLPSLPLCCAL